MSITFHVLARVLAPAVVSAPEYLFYYDSVSAFVFESEFDSESDFDSVCLICQNLSNFGGRSLPCDFSCITNLRKAVVFYLSRFLCLWKVEWLPLNFLHLLSCIQFFATPWNLWPTSCARILCMRFSRKKCWHSVLQDGA